MASQSSKYNYDVPAYDEYGGRQYKSELGTRPKKHWDAIPNTNPIPEQLRKPRGLHGYSSPEFYPNEAPGRLSNHDCCVPDEEHYQRDPAKFTPTMAYGNMQYHADEEATDMYHKNYNRLEKDPRSRLYSSTNKRRLRDEARKRTPSPWSSPPTSPFREEEYSEWQYPNLAEDRYGAAAQTHRSSNMNCAGRDAENQRYPTAHSTFAEHISHKEQAASRLRAGNLHRKNYDLHRAGYYDENERMEYEGDYKRLENEETPILRSEHKEAKREYQDEKRASRELRWRKKGR